MTQVRIGFIGLGAIGKPIAARIAAAGFAMSVFDIAGLKGRAPEGADHAVSSAQVAADAEIVFLSLPSIEALSAVADEIIQSKSATTVVVDTSTTGPSAAREFHARFAKRNIEYVDAPISGGVSRAYDGTLTTMYSGPAKLLTRLRPVFSAYCNNVFHVGDKPGQGQAMKILNNYASIACMLSTSEAIAYGAGEGLSMKTMLDVMNVSSGQSFATEKLFKNFVLPEKYDSGASATIVGKDLSLFVAEAKEAKTASAMAETAYRIFRRFLPDHADQDWLRIYGFIRDTHSKGVD